MAEARRIVGSELAAGGDLAFTFRQPRLLLFHPFTALEKTKGHERRNQKKNDRQNPEQAGKIPSERHDSPTQTKRDAVPNHSQPLLLNGVQDLGLSSLEIGGHELTCLSSS